MAPFDKTRDAKQEIRANDPDITLKFKPARKLNRSFPSSPDPETEPPVPRITQRMQPLDAARTDEDDPDITLKRKAIRRPSPPLPSSSPFNSYATGEVPIDQQVTASLIAIQVQETERVAEPEAKTAGMAGYVSQLRNLVKNSGIYALSSLASPLVALVLSPFLTYHLSRPDYGALAVLTTVISLAAGITQLGMNAAFFRAYCYDYESEGDRKRVLSTVVMLLLLISVPTAIAGVIGAPWLTTVLVNRPDLSNPVRLAAVAVLMQNLTIPGFGWLRAEGRAAFSATLSIVNLLVSASTTVVLVGELHLGIAGSLIATASGYGVVAACTLPVILLRAGLLPRLDIAWGLLTFGVPNVINLISGWVLQLSDRYLLGHLGSLSQAASYAVAYSLGGALSAVVLTPFSLAWPSAMFAIAKRDDSARVFQLMFRWFSLFLLFAAFGLAIAGTIVLDLFFPPSYHASAPIIPIIAVSILFSGVYNIFMTGVFIERKMWIAVTFTTVSALVNVGLNIVLIPLYGSMGAAIATLVAYVLLALLAYVVNRRIYPIQFEVGLFMLALAIGIAFYIGNSILALPQHRYVAWGISFGSLVLYGGCLALLVMFPKWLRRRHPRTRSQVEGLTI